jgi:Tfp pilus assembly protein PilP
MKHFSKTTAALLILLAGCSRKDSEVKTHMDEDYERFHKQLEKERSIDEYRRSPEYKAKVLRDLRRGMFGSSKTKEKVIP